MNLRQGLTKEGFWNDMMSLYPNATTHFCKWIDQYKEAVKWNTLFAANETTDHLHSSKYKFHEIPYEFQQGVWIKYAEETLNRMFEQPEYLFYCGDLQDDVIRVFKEIEPLLTAVQ